MTKPPDISDMDAECLRLGRGVLLTGLRHAVKILQAQIAQVEAGMYVPPPQIGNGTRGIRPAMQRTLESAGIVAPGLPAPGRKKRGKPHGGIKGYWAKMTPAERSVEMKRRLAKSSHAAKQPNHPRNANHPKHKQWLAKMKKAMRKSWDGLTPTVREQRIAASLAGRGVKRKTAPTVKLKRQGAS